MDRATAYTVNMYSTPRHAQVTKNDKIRQKSPTLPGKGTCDDRVIIYQTRC